MEHVPNACSIWRFSGIRPANRVFNPAGEFGIMIPSPAEACMAREARRDRKKEKFWHRMLRRQAGSGMSIRAWSREHNLHEHGFYWWRVRLARTGRGRRSRSVNPIPLMHLRSPRSKGKGEPAFVPVRVAPDVAVPTAGIEIVLSGDRRVRLSGSVNRQMPTEVLEAQPC
jgi:hypothetical protein